MTNSMKVEVELQCDLDPDHPDWPEVQWYPCLISEDELPTLTKDDLRRLAITSAKLNKVFAKARELLKDVTPSDRVRVCADRCDALPVWHSRNGESVALSGDYIDGFHVYRCGYSPASDPMLVEVKGRA